MVESGVIKKVSFSMSEKVRGQKVCVGMARRGRSFSMAEKWHCKKSKFQHGWKGGWPKKLVSSWLERVVVNKGSFSMAGKGPCKNMLK
jgi:hypothetical protein